ncbi:hypothetical protein C3F09_06655 [candidate division GN15 bacterium]|uniref:Tetratricopeptide repeat protein n=1 Tax=candidate division GN15 bacterium TaxID=2072418 RepID=A0A855X2P1_9BACT|nr:MAG: hypothetical protein C3F09_06655 [candidate division GN15 bacterium]
MILHLRRIPRKLLIVGKKKAIGQAHHEPSIERRVLIAYYATLAAFFVSSFFPQARLWGINWWAYFPLWVKLALLIGGTLIPLGIRQWSRRWFDPNSDISDRAYWLFSAGLLIGFGLLFYLLRAKTHFLGDGYQLLSTLSSENFFVKFRNRGSVGLQYFLMQLLGGRGEANALLSYQVTSISAGLLFLAVLYTAASKLFQKNIERILFALILSAGGYMLLFFGYVENYALFVVSVLAFVLIGVIVSERNFHRWWILVPQLSALFFHVFGCVLIPATAYLLVSNTKLSRHLRNLHWTVKCLIGAFGLTFAGVIFYRFYTTSYFFRFSLVPPIADRFTVEGYTLFSWNHLLDFANLLFVLFPGIGVLLTVRRLTRRKVLTNQAMCFLLLCVACTLGAAFIFDPKLGMPRDWDLFAFAGIPLATILVFNAISENRIMSRAAIVLALFLCVASIVPRSLVFVMPSLTTSHLLAYIKLDEQKSERTRFLLVQYLERTGSTRVLLELKKQGWDQLPEAYRILDSAMLLTDSGQIAPAKKLLDRVITLRPASADAWGNLGRCYSLEGHYDSALECFRVSYGLNPYGYTCMYNIGQVYYNLKQYDRAIEWFKDAIELEPNFVPALIGLSLSYREANRLELYSEAILRLATVPGAKVFVVQSIEELIECKQVKLAEQVFRTVIINGLDSSVATDLARRHPGILQR